MIITILLLIIAGLISWIGSGWVIDKLICKDPKTHRLTKNSDGSYSIKKKGKK